MVLVTPFKVTLMVLAFLLFTDEMLPFTVAMTVVSVDCLAKVKEVIFGAAYSYTVTEEEVTCAVLPRESVMVQTTLLLPLDSALVVKDAPV